MKKLKLMACVGALSFMVCGVVSAHEGDTGSHTYEKSSEVNKQIAEVRNATAKYHDVDKAIADGYVPTDHLVPNMGYHYVNPKLMADSYCNPLIPEVLIYEPTKNGVKLVGVEYISYKGETLFNTKFDPPGGIPFHSLHAWIWQPNPDGMFTPFNPNVANGK
jgi:hypothetical protein